MNANTNRSPSACNASSLSSQEEAWQKEILEQKKRFGQELIILTHHYQRPEIVSLGDRVGDSYELSKAARDAASARFIVFCGVRFMAEAASILCRADQQVIHPAADAGCPMADMAGQEAVRAAWDRLQNIRGAGSVMPVVYMNSSAELKALVGTWGGCVCTSSNAAKAITWALHQRPVVLFLPDEHLGRNTARQLGIEDEQVALWDPDQSEGGLSASELQRAKVLVWKGFCHVHTAFTLEDISRARAQYPAGRILVHPECTSQVVQAADGNGSTSYLVREVKNAAEGSVLIVGTEINLVARLAATHVDRTVVPLNRSLCPNMFKTSPKKLAESLRTLPDRLEGVEVPAEVRQQALLALERMLSI